VASAGILLGWRFNKGRIVLAILVLFLADRALVHLTISPSSSILDRVVNTLMHLFKAKRATMEVNPVIYNAVAFLLPLNLATLSLVKEQGLITMSGIRRFGLILLQISTVVVLYRNPQLAMNSYLKTAFIDSELLSQRALPQLALLSFGIAFLVSLFSFFQRRSTTESGFFWALVSSFTALTLGKTGSLSTIYFSTAGLVLIVAVIETSYGMAFCDELTGLPARRALNEKLHQLGNCYSVAMLDIDFFKKFNDSYGHDVGDQVLRMVATKLAEVNGGGKAFRYGGEEFAVIFPGKSVEEAIPYLEKLRRTIEGSAFTVRSKHRPYSKPDNPTSDEGSRKKVMITVSIGVAGHTGSQISAEEVMKAADEALYRAKEAGRNRIST
jgi:diguanylate cyclase (GGDEF)-like protein